ncbi:hypothetical protein HYR99_06410 [Candidatus Poribacteria bacterium]|nr:hypothetical protein [Candidatus Poribacteria bacterium]
MIIYVMDADGATPVQLTNNVRDEIYPTWSPSPNLAVSATERRITLWGKVKVGK